MVTNPTTDERNGLYAEAMAPGPPYMTIDKGALAKLLEDLQSAQADVETLTELLGEIQFIAIMGKELNEADRHLSRIEELSTTFLAKLEEDRDGS